MLVTMRVTILVGNGARSPSRRVSPEMHPDRYDRDAIFRFRQAMSQNCDIALSELRTKPGIRAAQ
jgi:hypothetical protein